MNQPYNRMSNMSPGWRSDENDAQENQSPSFEAKAQEASPIDAHHAQLEHALEGLSERIDYLIHRISPVMKQRSEKSEPTNADYPLEHDSEISPMAEKVFQHTEYVRKLYRKLDQAIGELEL